MGWSANILTNPDAATEDTSGWTTSGTVNIEENQALEDSYFVHEVDNHLYWTDLKHIVEIKGGLGVYHFRLIGDSYMEQEVVGASDATELRLEVTFQLVTAQQDWDPEVLGKAIAYVNYDDETKDFFFVPLVRGVTYSGHNLSNFWFYISADFELDEDKIYDSVKIKIATNENLTDGINIDSILLREYTE